MMPWEKYGQDTAASATGPWDKYAASSAPAAKPQTGLSALPPDTPTGNTVPSKVNADSIAHKILGVGEAGMAIGSGAVGGAIGQLYGAGKALTSGKYGTQAGVREGEQAGVNLANKLTYQPRTQTGQELTGQIGSALEASRLQGLPVEGGTVGRIADVPLGARAAGDALSGINRGVVQTAAAPAKALGRKAVSALPNVDPDTAALARDAHSMGFRLTPDQVYGNKYGKFAGELAGENPLIKNNREENQKVFNQHLVQQVGGTGDKLTRKVYADAMKKSGGTIGDIAEKTNIPVTPALTEALQGTMSEAGKYQTSDVSRVVNSYVDEINAKAVDGVLPGKAMRTINTKIGNQIRNTQNGDLKYALGDIQDVLQDHLNANLSPEDQAALTTARRQYAVGKTLEPLIAKSTSGDIPPSSLLGAITRTKAGKSAAARGAAGDLGKLADIGQKFLKPMPSSGTAERTLMQNLMAHPVGTLASGGAAALTSPIAAAYNRLGPGVTNQLINRPPQP